MADLGDYVERLRVLLHDSDEERWDDEALEAHIGHAVDDFSEVQPREETETLATTAGSRDLDISGLAGLVRIEAVEYPVDLYPRAYVRFETWGDVLTLHVDGAPGDGEDVRVYWGKRHEVDDTGSTLPAEAEETVLLGAAGYALVALAQYETNRVTSGGPRVPADYERQGNQRLAEFRRQLRRFGRASRVRTGVLYTPARAFEGRSMDPGP